MEPLDQAYLDRQCFGDRDLADELLRLFAAQCRTLVAAMRAADDATGGREAAHALLGAARAIGANPVADVAGRLELAFRDDEPRPVQVTLRKRLEREVGRAEAAIADRLCA